MLSNIIVLSDFNIFSHTKTKNLKFKFKFKNVFGNTFQIKNIVDLFFNTIVISLKYFQIIYKYNSIYLQINN